MEGVLISAKKAGFAEQIGSRLRWHRIPAGAHEQPGTEPILEQAHLSADGPMRDVELPCGVREAAQASGGFEGFDRIQRRQAGSNHGVSFSHSARQNKSFVIEPSHRQMGLRRVRRWHRVMTIAALSTATKPAQSKARVLWIACGAHALHDGFTDALYVLLPLWQAQFALSYAAIGMLRALYTAVMAGLQVPSLAWHSGLAERKCSRSAPRPRGRPICCSAQPPASPCWR